MRHGNYAIENVENKTTTGRKVSATRWALTILLCLKCGFIFGLALEKGRVFEPGNIRLQMVFRRWIMMKMFLAAMGVGSLALCLLSVLPIPWLREKMKAADEAYAGTMRGKNSLAVAVGPFILGVGMSLSGACPGMVLPQVGAWAHQSILTLIGALVGALFYGLIHDRWVMKVFPPGRFVLPETMEDVVPVSRQILGGVLGVLMLILVIILEVVVPWKEDVGFGEYAGTAYSTVAGQSAPSILQLIAWPPSVCGTLIGFLQIPIVLAVGDTLGGSSSYITIVSQPFACSESFPYLSRARSGLGNWWQVFYVIGGILGGLASAGLSQTLGVVGGVRPWEALLGGFLLLFGARLGSGCTSGHGLSGMALLYTTALVAVPAMFAGAIVTAFILQAAGELTSLHSWI